MDFAFNGRGATGPTGPTGGAGPTGLAGPAYSPVDLAAQFGLTRTAGTDRTLGVRFFAPVAGKSVTGVRFSVKYSGSGTDTYKISIWRGNSLVTSASASVTADGTYTVTFGSPVSASTGVDITIGIYWTAPSAQYTWSSTTGTTYFASGASPRVNPSVTPVEGPAGFVLTSFGTFAAGDAQPTSEAYTGFNELHPLEPF